MSNMTVNTLSNITALTARARAEVAALLRQPEEGTLTVAILRSRRAAAADAVDAAKAAVAAAEAALPASILPQEEVATLEAGLGPCPPSYAGSGWHRGGGSRLEAENDIDGDQGREAARARAAWYARRRDALSAALEAAVPLRNLPYPARVRREAWLDGTGEEAGATRLLPGDYARHASDEGLSKAAEAISAVESGDERRRLLAIVVDNLVYGDAAVSAARAALGPAGASATVCRPGDAVASLRAGDATPATRWARLIREAPQVAEKGTSANRRPIVREAAALALMLPTGASRQ